MDKQELLRLEQKVADLRALCLLTTYDAGSGHIGGGMSVMDILAVLYHKIMKIDIKNPNWEDRDRMIMSKGHAGIAHASVLADLGFIDKKDLKTFNLTGSKLGIHLDSNKVAGVDASTGSLGHGLSMASGIALAGKINNKDYITYCILGDGECNEGAIWESAMAISHFKITNLVTIVDRNKCMIDGRTESVMALEPFADKWRAFGFEVVEVDGHSIPELVSALEKAKNGAKTAEKPTVIIANTIKGAGINYMEDDYRWHYGAIDEKKYNEANLSLKAYHEKRIKA
ncbi:MAG: transketolase [Firmicutes bacterium]|nr:transketolase [Bacillota bacterium]